MIKIGEETENDKEMQLLVKYIRDGWIKSKNKVPVETRQYFNYADELSVINGLIFKNSRIVVPKSLRKEMLKLLYYNHLGIEKCKNRAKEILFWPMMSKEIKDGVENCNICMKYKKAHVKKPLLNRELLNRPWEVLGTDIFFYKNKNWLLTVDY